MPLSEKRCEVEQLCLGCSELPKHLSMGTLAGFAAIPKKVTLLHENHPSAGTVLFGIHVMGVIKLSVFCMGAMNFSMTYCTTPPTKIQKIKP